LLLVEGLTLAGARRKLEEEAPPVLPDEPAMNELNELRGRNARERLTAVKQGLRSILELLGSNAQPARKRAVSTSRGKAARRKPAPTRSRRRR